MKEFTSRILIGFTLITFFCLNANSQKEFNARAFFVEAESYFLFEEYEEALHLYQRILSKEPLNYNVMYKIGVCYLNDLYQKDRAIKYLFTASDHINLKYKSNSYKEVLAPLDVLYYLGQAYRVNGSIDLAIKYYTKFKDQVDPELYNLDVVNAEIATCEVAKVSLKSPIYSKAVNLGKGVNSRFAEQMAVLSGNGKTLVFTKELQFYDAIFITTLDANGVWSPPYNLTPEFSLDGNSYTTGISYNGDEVLVYRSDNFDGNIYSSKKVDKLWQPLTKLNENINTKYWESHASFSADGNYLYFTSNRRDGYGGLDIYRSKKGPKGDWGVAVNLGPMINTSYNEETPFISPDDSKLYFSSLGHSGMGGYDIYVSEKIGSDKWSKPLNIGYPLNTTDDDMFFCPVEIDGYTGIFSYYDEKTSYGLKDIYWIEVYNEILPRPFTLSGKVKLPSIELLSKGKVKASLIDSKTGKIVSEAEIDNQGNFIMNPSQGSYQLLIDGEGIKPVSVPVELEIAQKDKHVELALINAVADGIGEDVTIITPTSLPVVSVVGERYIITDTTPITINLEIEKGSDLQVETYGNNSLTKTEGFHVSKSRFSYVLVPVVGENKIIFTVTDNSGNKNKEEVIVYYTPKESHKAITEIEAEPIPTALPEVALLASAGLQAYLLTLGDVDFESKSELYNMLIDNAEANDYTVEDVNKLFALMLTQRDKEEFLSELNITEEFDDKRLSDSILNELDFPLSIVYETKDDFAISIEEINVGLVSMVPFNGTPNSEMAYILSFVDGDLLPETNINPSSNEETWKALQNTVDKKNAEKALDLASTTQELEFYYQNLLASTDGAIKDILIDIDFNEQGIDNSIDLVNYLYKVAPEKNISLAELIAILEASQNSQDQNLHRFRESLASAATGELKTTIEGLILDNGSITNFEQIIDALLLESKTSSYSPLEVYELMLKLLGINNVNELAIALQEGASGQLDSLIGTLDLMQFSNSVELIQYLLSQAAYYDFTASDIHNLLLRMLLEKGIENYLDTEDILRTEKILKRRKLIATIVLANGLLILLLFIFWRRKKKKQTE